MKEFVRTRSQRPGRPTDSWKHPQKSEAAPATSLAQCQSVHVAQFAGWTDLLTRTHIQGNRGWSYSCVHRLWVEAQLALAIMKTRTTGEGFRRQAEQVSRQTSQQHHLTAVKPATIQLYPRQQVLWLEIFFNLVSAVHWGNAV
jgi:hypothetical protein